MHREEVQKMLVSFGFSETLNRTLEGVNKTHMIHCCEKLKKFVEYYVDPLGIVNSIWGFNDDNLSRFENTGDFEGWLKG